MWIWYILAGAVSGVVAGMGMGGGTLLIPILTLLFDMEQKISQSINLLVFIPTAIVALIIHYKNKLVVTKIGLIVCGAGIVLSLFGSYLATTLSNDMLRKYFGIFLILIGVFQLIDSSIQLLTSTKLPKNVFVKTKLNIFINKR